MAAAVAWQEGCETDAESSDSDSGRAALPRVVGLGLRAVFDMIRETETEQPAVCQRGLRSLLDVLQGLQPEDLRLEPETVLDSMFTTLLELASKPGAPLIVNGNLEPGRHIRALACSCLLALAVATGSTGHLLRSTAALLMSPRSHAAELVLLPGILASLQRSVHSLLIRRAVHPDFMSHGVPASCLLDSFPVLWREREAGPGVREPGLVHSIASDGEFLYLHSDLGLFKLGSGYSGTMKGQVYRHKPDFYPSRPGWLGVASGSLYYCPPGQADRLELVVVDRTTLEQVALVSSLDRFPAPHLLLSDGEQVGLVVAGQDDTFTLKFLSPTSSPMKVTGELPIKLARKCVELVGASVIEEATAGERFHVEFGVEDDVACVGSGKEFGLMLTSAGKLYYTGKSAAISHKQVCPAGRWNEVVVSRAGPAATNITQFSIGHDGLHALLVGEDGSVFFTGTSRRGEDADLQSKPRRQPKPSKPKKMSRMEGHQVATTACNSGSSCIVTKKGELYVFGKDSSHADFTTGHVTDLIGHNITQVAAGKAHIVALSSTGEVFTFGMNNKGQCGREFPVKSESQTEAGEGSDHDADNEAEIVAAGPEVLCPAGKHKWKHDQCMVCTVCGECTGYGSGCVSASRPDRNPGMFCGCGSGDSGCGECGACRGCCGEAGLEVEPGQAAGPVQEAAGPARDLIRLDLLAGPGAEAGGRGRDHRDKFLKRRLAKMGKEAGRRSRKYGEPGRERRGGLRGASQEEAALEKDASARPGGGAGSSTSLRPGRVAVPGPDSRVVAAACGLHHTVLLTSAGQVFAFGSNSHGQLGLGDLVPRGCPALVSLPERVTRVAAGSHHSLALTATGRVFTWGSNARLQLGRAAPTEPGLSPAERELWFAVPGPVPGLGSLHGRTVTWVGASAEQTILKLDESLINAQNLVGATLCSNKHQVLLLPTHNQQPTSFSSLCISRSDGFCRSFSGAEQVEWAGRAAALDPLYNVLWSLCSQTATLHCHHPTSADTDLAGRQSVLQPDLALPVTPGCLVSRSQAALNLLSCLDTVTSSSPAGLAVPEEETARASSGKSLSR